MFDRLPYELQLYVYEFDPTYRERYQPVINDLKVVHEIESKVDYIVATNLDYGVVLYRRIRSLVRQYRKRQLIMALRILYKPFYRQKYNKYTKKCIISYLCAFHENQRYLSNLSFAEMDIIMSAMFY